MMIAAAAVGAVEMSSTPSLRRVTGSGLIPVLQNLGRKISAEPAPLIDQRADGAEPGKRVGATSFLRSDPDSASEVAPSCHPARVPYVSSRWIQQSFAVVSILWNLNGYDRDAAVHGPESRSGMPVVAGVS